MLHPRPTSQPASIWLKWPIGSQGKESRLSVLVGPRATDKGVPLDIPTHQGNLKKEVKASTEPVKEVDALVELGLSRAENAAINLEVAGIERVEATEGERDEDLFFFFFLSRRQC
ncbi:hypothetical protein LWI28_000918 [Acer negundo]|uniref:Uncharacterized protein n=1 Tax=Acer negundo TaxID=4023 RepID=A0AAD5P0P6_ACENE|nr:hypothetical protein LWI28_000918 [Acer negundo]